MFARIVSSCVFSVILVLAFPAEVRTDEPVPGEPGTRDPRNYACSGSGEAGVRELMVGETTAIISNGTVQLGINQEGQLNVPSDTPSWGGVRSLGLRFVPTNAEATAPGCLCEGWGAADAITGVSGAANQAQGIWGMIAESFVADASTATCVVNIQDMLRVTHFYHPSASLNLYRADVAITNISPDPVELLYRRVMDWDVEPTTFWEYVTVDTGVALNLVYTSNNGFASADPLEGPSDLGYTGSFTDIGPADHGALFDFNFGTLPAGETKEFTIFYGAAATEAEAHIALGDVGAEAYSFGQPSTPDGPTLGTPNTFIFAFSGIGGIPVNPTVTGVSPPRASNAGSALLTVSGAAFRNGATVKLVKIGSPDIEAGQTTFINPWQLRARFDLSGAQTGLYDVVLTNPDDRSATLAAAFEVVEGGEAKLFAKLQVPASVRPNREYICWLEYGNEGEVEMPIPLFVVSSAENAPMRLTRREPYRHTPLHVLGTVGDLTIGTVSPGENHRIPIYFEAIEVATIHFNLAWLADGTEAIDWPAVEEQIRPADADPGDWEVVFEQLKSQIGATWSDYVAALTVNAERFAAVGRPTSDARLLLGMELDKAFGYPTGMISGQVSHRDTALPLANVKVKATDSEGSFDSAEVFTRADGSFLLYGLASGSYDLDVEGYMRDASASVTLDTDVSGVSLEVVKSGAIRGVVRAPDGTPIEDAWVQLIDTEPLAATTDASGRYGIRGIPPGNWQVVVEAAGYASPAPTPLTVNAGDDLTLDLSVLLGAAVSGVVTDATGSPLANAPVIAAGTAAGPRTATTDASGHYAISGLADGEWELTGAAPGHVPASITPPALAEGEVLTGQNISLSPAVAFTGSVVSQADSTPIPYAFLVFLEGDEFAATSLADGDGLFAQDQLGPGTYTVAVSLGGYLDAEITFDLPPEGLAEPLVIALEPAPSFAEGTSLSLAAGDPPPEFILRLYQFALKDLARGWRGLGWDNAAALLLHYLGPDGHDDGRVPGARNFLPGSPLSDEAKGLTNVEQSFQETKEEVEERLSRILPDKICQGESIVALSGECTALIFYFPGRQWGNGDPGWSFGATNPPGIYKVVGASFTPCGEGCYTANVTMEYTFRDIYQFGTSHEALGGYDAMGYWLGVAGWATAFPTSVRMYDTFSLDVDCPDDPDVPEDPIDDGSTDIVRPVDPNEKVGPPGHGPERVVSVERELVYAIYFENQPGATAPAQEVRITDVLDADLDWPTFRATEVAFGSHVVPLTGDSGTYSVRETAEPWWVDITADIDYRDGTVIWLLRTIDPATGDLPEDALAGFLPPNDATGRGEGHVVFSIKPRTDRPDGTRVDNQATIVFDTEPPISTNEVFNTLLTILNVPPEVEISPPTQDVQYSDPITPIVVQLTDVALDVLSANTSWSSNGTDFSPGLPAGLSLSSEGCSVSDGMQSCVWTVAGKIGVPAGTYMIRVEGGDDDGGMTTTAEVTLVVGLEDASVLFDEGNPLSVQVAAPGGKSGPFSLRLAVRELRPDRSSVTPPAPGDIGLAVVSMTLVPVGPGGPVNGTCTPTGVAGTGYDAVLTVACSFNNVPVNTYGVAVLVNTAGYYLGTGDSVLVVFDPSLGFTTGGCWFYWPGSADPATGYLGDRTNAGFNAKYLGRSNVKGSLLLIRHLRDGSIYRLKSNVMTGLSVGESRSTPAFGWATITGKATYQEPAWPDAIGNYSFTTYVEDRGEPGTNDRFWIEVKDRDRLVEPDLSMNQRATDNAVTIQGGNIIVPQTTKGR